MAIKFLDLPPDAAFAGLQISPFLSSVSKKWPATKEEFYTCATKSQSMYRGLWTFSMFVSPATTVQRTIFPIIEKESEEGEKESGLHTSKNG